MTLSADRLSSIMKEIYYDDDLVPSLFTDRLYSAKCFMGKLWRVLTILLRLLIFIDLKTRRLKTILEKVERTFTKLKGEIETIFQEYQWLMGRLSSGYAEDRGLFATRRFAINSWNDKFRPFIKLVNAPQGAKIQALFSILFDWNQASRYHPLIDLEALMGEDLPYEPLAKLAVKKELTKKEEGEVKVFIDFVESHSIKQRQLHKALKVFVQNIKEQNRDKCIEKPSTANLEIALLDLGLTTIIKEDPKHIEWRKTLKKGQIVTINGQEHLLGDEIRRSHEGFNQNRVFKSAENKAHVIIVGKNLSTLKIRRRATKTSASGMYSPAWVEIDKSGRAGIQERGKRVSKIKWLSKEKFDDQDLNVLYPFIGFIKFMCQIEQTPKRISYKHLIFNQGVLSTTKPTFYSEFCYPELERLAWKAAQKNRVIFEKIVQESGLMKHPHAAYFEDIISAFQNKDTLDAQLEAALSKHKITDPKTVDAGKKLREDVEAHFKKVKKPILKKCEDDDRGKMEEKIRGNIVKGYRESFARSFLLDTRDK